MPEFITAKEKSVLWKHELKNFMRETQGIYTLEVLTPEGVVFYEADYILACDGYHSRAREIAKIPYEGEELPGRYLMIDATFTGDLSSNTLFMNYSTDIAIGIVPMKESVRTIIDISRLKGYENCVDPDLDTFNTLIKKAPLNGQFSNLLWKSHFWIHNRLAKYFSQDNIFLVGDAAHVHSPAGGHGMNTGIQDAFNLAWKLHEVLQKNAHPSVLETYNSERRPVAQSVLKETKTMTRLWSIKNIFLSAILKMFAKVFFKSSQITLAFSEKICQLDIHLRSPLITKSRTKKIHAGQRAPEAHFNDGKSLYNIIAANLAHKVLCFDTVISKESADYNTILISPEEKSIYSVYGVLEKTYVVIRPDQYIGLITSSPEAVSCYFERIAHYHI